MQIVSFDLSLAATGWAAVQQTSPPVVGKVLRALGVPQIVFGTLSTKLKGMDRLDWIRTEVYKLAKPADLVIFEELAFAAHDTNHERAGLAMLIRHLLWKKGIRYVLVSPSTLKKFVTGSGKAEKSLIIKEVFKRWNHDAKNDNEADAIGLLYMGMMLTEGLPGATKAQLETKVVLEKSHPWLKEL